MSTTTGAHSGLSVRVDAPGLRELMKAAGEFDANLTAALRTEIRDAAKVVMGRTSSAVRGGSYAAQTGLREGLARGLRLELSTTTSRPGVRIVSTGSGLPESKRVMVKAWERATFQHPVFGQADVMVSQRGDPYFNKTIKAGQPAVTDAVTTAMERAAKALGAEVRG